jgi:hypothetical protein
MSPDGLNRPVTPVKNYTTIRFTNPVVAVSGHLFAYSVHHP